MKKMVYVSQFYNGLYIYTYVFRYFGVAHGPLCLTYIHILSVIQNENLLNTKMYVEKQKSEKHIFYYDRKLLLNCYPNQYQYLFYRERKTAVISI